MRQSATKLAETTTGHATYSFRLRFVLFFGSFFRIAEETIPRKADGKEKLRFRHWGSLAGQKVGTATSPTLENGEKKIPVEFTSGRVYSWAVGGQWRSPGTRAGSYQRMGHRGTGENGVWRQGTNTGAASAYGARAVSNSEYCSRPMRRSWSRNLPRTGSAMSSRIPPNSASVSRPNRCR